MIHIIGCTFIIGATTLAGVQRAGSIEQQYLEMQHLYEIICTIQSEIHYARAYLSEIFRKTGKNAKEPYSLWLTELGKWMEEEQRETFEQMWKKSIDHYLKGTLLPKKELERLIHLGNQLGIADIQMQVRLLELYLEQLSNVMEETREGMKTKIRLCHCLGVMSGILISVLLL